MLLIALLAAEATALEATGAELLVLHRDRPARRAQDSPVPVFDTTRLHAYRAVDLALGSEPA